MKKIEQEEWLKTTSAPFKDLICIFNYSVVVCFSQYWSILIFGLLWCISEFWSILVEFGILVSFGGFWNFGEFLKFLKFWWISEILEFSVDFGNFGGFRKFRWISEFSVDFGPFRWISDRFGGFRILPDAVNNVVLSIRVSNSLFIYKSPRKILRGRC